MNYVMKDYTTYSVLLSVNYYIKCMNYCIKYFTVQIEQTDIEMSHVALNMIMWQ